MELGCGVIIDNNRLAQKYWSSLRLCSPRVIRVQIGPEALTPQNFPGNKPFSPVIFQQPIPLSILDKMLVGLAMD